MKIILILAAALSMSFAIVGCGQSAAEKALETSAPPPGPNVDPNPPAVHNKKIPTPPSAGGPTGGSGGN